MTVRRNLLTIKIPCSILVLIAAICFGSMQTAATAQTLPPAPADDTTAASSTAPATKVETPNNQNAEILKQLQEMRNRIQQLEEQLKAQSSSSSSAQQPSNLQNAS